MLALRCRPVALALLVLHLGGCYAWHPSTVSPTQLIEDETPRRVRLTGFDGKQLVVQRPLLRGDSIVGRRLNSSESRGMPVADVRALEVSHFSAGRTAGLVALSAGVVLLGVVVYVCSELCGDNN